MKEGGAAAVANGEYKEQEKDVFDIGRDHNAHQCPYDHRDDERRRHRAQRHAFVFKTP